MVLKEKLAAKTALAGESVLEERNWLSSDCDQPFQITHESLHDYLEVYFKFSSVTSPMGHFGKVSLERHSKFTKE